MSTADVFCSSQQFGRDAITTVIAGLRNNVNINTDWSGHPCTDHLNVTGYRQRGVEGHAYEVRSHSMNTLTNMTLAIIETRPRKGWSPDALARTL